MSESISMCSLSVAGRQFGVDTRKIREVLGMAQTHAVPLAPAFVGGVIAYRGEVVTAVSLRALLGEPRAEQPGCVLVLDGDAEEEQFGLMVDRVGGVVTLERSRMAANPTTLDEVGRMLFCGAFRTENGLLVQLDPEGLQPKRLAECGLFAAGMRTRLTAAETVQGGRA